MLHAGYLGGITILLEAGASINLQNKRGHTPLFVAVTGGHFFCVQHLIKVSAGTSPQCRNAFVQSPVVSEFRFPV